jgi:hypothetical protein
MTSYTQNLASKDNTASSTANSSASSAAKAAAAATKATTAAGVAAVPLRIGGIILALVQFAFAFLAAWDLAMRAADDVRGPKLAWAPALFINWIGPAAYFLFGIRHDRR